MVKKVVFSITILLLLAGCNPEVFFEKLIPNEEIAFSKQYFALFQSRNFDAIEKKINPTSKNDLLRYKLEQMAAFFPEEEPKAINTVDSHIFKTTKLWQGTFTFQYEFQNKWLLAHIVLEKKEDIFLVNAVNVKPLSDSLENINQFTFQEKSAMSYLIFALAIILPLFTVFTLAFCLKTPIPKGKWFWMIFILFGFTQVVVNWTTGGIIIKPISFQLFSSSFIKASFYAPVFVSISFPLGAIIFWIKRKKWLTLPVENKD
ncbi:hypothetical protein [Candidatus Parabeggiatoa sp. HSG14]|uniref:hypothetical protein n=1 Tax=Candidatus Parabeggiatoa sp. HSG14 TaxID=3055593 RepID=UPI0025A86935|nr:hypothetical protein [Thiotrichales bacterium HSG14]